MKKLNYQKKVEKLEKEIEQLKRMAWTDSLTKIYNRRGFLEVASHFFPYRQKIKGRKYFHRRRALKYFSLIFLDIDDFKKVNDTYGHAKGDIVLKKLASLLKKILRKTDILARWGGEEFVIALINTPYSDACSVAEKIQRKVAQTKVGRINITVSIGVVPRHKEKLLSTLINKADKLMYQAKKEGKNRVITL